jgi:menaquinol-cytochrome c reductase iron-sulfur subunit
MAKSTLPQGRRFFLSKMTAIIAGAIALLTPAAAGIAAFFSPAAKKGSSGRFIRVTNVDAVPEDGSPQKFPVIADRTDAWNRFPNEPVGAVYLRRINRNDIESLQVVCPHAGCTITVESGKDGIKYFCPCHNAAFDVAGKRTDAVSPSPRDMDTLETEIRKNEVWVKFQTFRSGVAEKVAQS